MVKFSDRHDMSIDVYSGRKTTTQQQNINLDIAIIDILR